jgi:hypothetical protein
MNLHNKKLHWATDCGRISRSEERSYWNVHRMRTSYRLVHITPSVAETAVAPTKRKARLVLLLVDSPGLDKFNFKPSSTPLAPGGWTAVRTTVSALPFPSDGFCDGRASQSNPKIRYGIYMMYVYIFADLHYSVLRVN